MALLDIGAEAARAARAGGDDKFWKTFTYFFELFVPPNVTNTGAQASYVYPLILAPESYHVSEPFAVDKAYTAGSGIFVEENGILAREITISGTTGWRPKAFGREISNTNPSGTVVVPPEGRSFSRALFYNVLEALSGLRHLQFLQDAVFRTYGDLKRDPATAQGTELFWHNPKDDEHWRVHPLSFELEQSATQGGLQRYTIRLLATEGAQSFTLSFSEDEGVLKALKDVDRMIHAGLGDIQGAINDLAGVQNEARLRFQGIGTVLDNVGDIVVSVGNFLAGSAAFISSAGTIAASPIEFLNTVERVAIDVPYAFVQATMVGLDRVLEAINPPDLDSPNAPDSFINTLRRIGDGLNVIASYPEAFQTAIDARVASFQNKADLSASLTSAQQALGAATTPPTSLRDFDKRTLSPGDIIRASTELGLGKNLPTFRGAIERTIEGGDTLTTLAARFLGDARLWKFIAVFNNLLPPFISDEGLPGTLDVGDKILIPTQTRSQEDRASPSTLGVEPEEAAAIRALGTDYLLVPSANERGRFTWAIDAINGSTDFQTTAGVANMQQGLKSRLRTEKGTDINYRNLGMQRVIALGLTVVDLETLQLRAASAIQADPRVAAIRRIRADVALDGDPDDAVSLDMDVEVRGLSRPENIVHSERG